MAEFTREGDELVQTLDGLEKTESLHGDVRVPMSAVRGVEVVDDVIHAAPAPKEVDDGPGLVLLDPDDRVHSMTGSAERLLDGVIDAGLPSPGRLPAVVYAVVAGTDGFFAEGDAI